MEEPPTKRLLILASDDADVQWTAWVMVEDDPTDRFYVEDYCVMMEHLIRLICHTARKRWPGSKFIVGGCHVENDEDAGYLKPLLQAAFDKGS